MVADKFIRPRVNEACGGVSFDKGGSYVFSEMLKAERKLAEKSEPGRPETAVLPFSVADPVWKMGEGAVEAGNSFYRVCADATRYTDLAGIRNFTLDGEKFSNTNEALAFFIGSNMQFDLAPDMVQYSPGSIKRALAEYIPKAFLDSNTLLIMPDPSYGVLAEPQNRNGAFVVKVPLISDGSRYDIDLEAAEYQIKVTGAKKVVMYVNVPHNPTGFGYNLQQWKRLLNFARKKNILLVVDEAYVDLIYNDQCCSVTQVPWWSNNCIVLQSVSKGYSATGLRFGWIMSNPTAISVLKKVMDAADSGMSGMTIMQALYCVSNPYLAWQTRDRYREIHSSLTDTLYKFEMPPCLIDGGLCQLSDFPRVLKNGMRFEKPSQFASWFRTNKLISVMPQDAIGKIRWAATFRPQPEFGLMTNEDVLNEVARRFAEIF